MIPPKNNIIDHMLDSRYKPAKLKELARQMGVEQVDYRDFRNAIRALVDDGELVRIRNNRYTHPDLIEGITGTLKIHRKGLGFVARKGVDSDIFIPRGGMGAALDGDRVCVELNGLWSREGLPQGVVVEVVSEGQKEFVGILCRRGRHWIIDVDDMELERDIIVDPSRVENVEEGDRIVVRIVDRKGGHTGLKGEIIEVIGSPDDPSLDFESIVRRFALPNEFSTEAMADVDNTSVDFAAEVLRRKDYRQVPCFTIDPMGAQDHDDAVSLQRREGGGYLLMVHIADVSHYVREGTALDYEARERGTSTYLIDRVLHMLPENLAAEKCSLKPDEDRLALSVVIELEEGGQVSTFDICETVIRSTTRFSYEDVQAVLDAEVDGDRDKNKPWRDELVLMAELCHKRNRIRSERGCLELDLPEANVELDREGKPQRLGVSPRYLSNRIIEEFMLVANECVGRFCFQRNLPVLYRTHLPPSAKKLDVVFELIPGAQTGSSNAENMEPRDMQKLLKQAQGTTHAELVSKLLLRSLSRAEYNSEDRGHFGLACTQYLHFTSPIRRYPDLFVHRVVKAVIRREWHEREDSILRAKVADLAKSCSVLERRAEAAERTYKKIKQMRFMERHIGEEFDGVVSGVLRSGFFVEVGSFLVDGFCFVRDLKDYVEFDERKHRLVGRRSRFTIQLGMPVRVVVTAVDWNALEMDLMLCGKEGTKPEGNKKSAKKKKKGDKAIKDRRKKKVDGKNRRPKKRKKRR